MLKQEREEVRYVRDGLTVSKLPHLVDLRGGGVLLDLGKELKDREVGLGVLKQEREEVRYVRNFLTLNRLPDLADFPEGGVLLDLGGLVVVRSVFFFDELEAPRGGLLFVVVVRDFFFFDELREEGEWQDKIMLL